ncbi:hypothetical protein BpHYR1_030037 [Brachionus plicatilis]|uniref:Uncharacterized protein n=1 Tax=Brachionus plicatilis TaxID=10195 RepID=A0A3M7S3G9_BRAPC|nr:hypothetical protein BpHYR1_030037 [Brachionus plicatilis]
MKINLKIEFWSDDVLKLDKSLLKSAVRKIIGHSSPCLTIQKLQLKFGSNKTCFVNFSNWYTL